MSNGHFGLEINILPFFAKLPIALSIPLRIIGCWAMGKRMFTGCLPQNVDAGRFNGLTLWTGKDNTPPCSGRPSGGPWDTCPWSHFDVARFGDSNSGLHLVTTTWGRGVGACVVLKR